MIYINIPSSKSLTQRALILASLSDHPVLLENYSDSSDSVFLKKALELCGVKFEIQNNYRLMIFPDKIVFPNQIIYTGDGGTTIRFLSALSLVGKGQLKLDCDERMKLRPISGMFKALRTSGVAVSDSDRYFVELQRRFYNRKIFVDTTHTSQYLSALMLVSPFRAVNTKIKYTKEVVSRPYVEMTENIISEFGISIKKSMRSYSFENSSKIKIDKYSIEPDLSAAAFFHAAQYITGKSIVLTGYNNKIINRNTHNFSQGDKVFFQYSHDYINNISNHFNLTDYPDLIAPMTSLAVAGNRILYLHGVDKTIYKESARPLVLVNELRKTGMKIYYNKGTLTVHPKLDLKTVILDSFFDHRMAMTFGIISLANPRISVKSTTCVNKSFPDFWKELDKLK
ncbi:MAG: hypothetical protein JXR95_08480 [Deltaproteobacteria bacterium]|nr:hypothetical protein [Deltaproteobacteria bacterium]